MTSLTNQQITLRQSVTISFKYCFDCIVSFELSEKYIRIDFLNFVDLNSITPNIC